MPKITTISPRKLIKVFEKFGFVVSKRKRGDHIVMRKEGNKRPLVIPDYGEIPVFIILKNIKSAGLSREKYLEILGKI